VKPTRTTSAIVALIVSLLPPAAARAQQQPAAVKTPPVAVNQDAKAIADFKTRVDAYDALRKKADDSAPPLKKTDEPADIKAAQQALVERIGAARSTAKQGDIFTPDITAFFKRVLRPESKEKDAKTIMKEDKPAAAAVSFKINGPYPDKQPLATSPPEMLAKLPALPKDIDYRFVDKHLILRDSRANTIIDYIPNAIP
jgi:hypothetical protein